MTNPGTWTWSHATHCSGLPSSAPDSWSDTCPPTPWAVLGPGLPSTSCFSRSDPGTSRHSGMLAACHPPPWGSCCAQAAGGRWQGGRPLGGSLGWVARPRQSPDSQQRHFSCQVQAWCVHQGIFVDKPASGRKCTLCPLRAPLLRGDQCPSVARRAPLVHGASWRAPRPPKPLDHHPSHMHCVVTFLEPHFHISCSSPLRISVSLDEILIGFSETKLPDKIRFRAVCLN